MSVSAEVRLTSCKSVCQAAVMNCLLAKGNRQEVAIYKASIKWLAQFVKCDTEADQMFSKRCIREQINNGLILLMRTTPSVRHKKPATGAGRVMGDDQE